jgi:hypothetical protein
MAQNLRAHDGRQPENNQENQSSERCKHELRPLFGGRTETDPFCSVLESAKLLGRVNVPLLFF